MGRFLTDQSDYNYICAMKFGKQLPIWIHLVRNLSLNKKDNSDTKKENNSWKDTFIALEYKTVQMSKKLESTGQKMTTV